MANIITSLNSLANSTGERDALIAEIQTGWQLEKETEKARETEAERDARAFKNMKSIGSMGKMVAAIPARDYFGIFRKSSLIFPPTLYNANRNLRKLLGIGQSPSGCR